MLHEDWVALASSLEPRGDHFIDGRYRPSLSGRRFATVNPATGQAIAEVAAGQAEDVDLAVRAARAAFDDSRWRLLAPRQRATVLRRFAQAVEGHREELALLECLDMGKPIRDALAIDLPETVRTLEYFSECIDKIEGVVTHTEARALHLITHEPLGVVGAITPWNYPLLMAVWKLAPALAAGNSVVLKPAEAAPLSCGLLASLFVEAGGPAGVLNVVHGEGGVAGKALALHPDVDKISFTGSTAVGKLLLQYAAQSNMKRVALETGGKSPQIFLPDAYELDAAVDGAINGIYDNAGQVCNAGSRLLVHESMYEAFVEAFTGRALQRYRPGDPLDPSTTLGPLANAQQHARVLACLRQAVDQGAGVEIGQENLAAGADARFFRPTLLSRVEQGSRIVQEEVFGPLATIQTFATEEQALTMANDSIYGLAAAVWTSDLRRAHRMVRALQAGVVWVNCFGDGDMTQPFGGYKQSGNSRDKHMTSLLAYTQTKSAWFSLQP